jgi:hypothetical protein
MGFSQVKQNQPQFKSTGFTTVIAEGTTPNSAGLSGSNYRAQNNIVLDQPINFQPNFEKSNQPRNRNMA